jgi:hypothetical protein
MSMLRQEVELDDIELYEPDASEAKITVLPLKQYHDKLGRVLTGHDIVMKKYWTLARKCWGEGDHEALTYFLSLQQTATQDEQDFGYLLLDASRSLKGKMSDKEICLHLLLRSSSDLYLGPSTITGNTYQISAPLLVISMHCSKRVLYGHMTHGHQNMNML